MRATEPLRVFLHLSRTLHFGRAAAEAHLSPSALSRAIQRLEHETGLTLFVRDRRHVELTADGRRFADYAADAIDRWERFARQDEMSGELAIFCTVTAAQSLLPDMLVRFREAYPDVHIRLETGYAADALAMLDAGIDVTVAALPASLPRSIVAQTLAVTPLVFVVPAAMRGRWTDLPLVLPPSGVARSLVDRWLRERGRTPAIASEIASHEAILALVVMGCGVGVVPELVLERSALRDRLRVVPVRGRVGDLHVGACALRRRLREPLVAALWDTIASHPQA